MFAEGYADQEILTWDDVDKVIEHLLQQFNTEYDGLVMITRGGLFPGGILCEAMGIKNVHTAAVHFTNPPVTDKMAWPTFMQFPIDTMITGRKLLVIDDIWVQGINMIAVKSRLEAARAYVETAVLHYKPKSNMFPGTGPDYYGAITTRFILYPWNMSPGFSPDYRPHLPYRPTQLD